MKVHFVQHNKRVIPGEYLAWAERHGFGVSYTRCWEYDKIPKSADADFLIVLGGSQSPATTKAQCDYYDADAEKEIIRTYIDSNKVVIGVCLGAQLMGEALGAPYLHSPEVEIGPVQAFLTDEGRNDPLFDDFPDRFLAGEWHHDMPGLTDSAVILAYSEGCPRQIVRYGEFAYGFQTHMELTHEIIAESVKAAKGNLKKTRFTQSAEELLAFDYTDMNAMLSSFLDRLLDKYRRYLEN